ncbi:MAG: hypothetical protein IT462_06735 [Planctomycetes bacterium]|nr:hypothetical protein [Planctomycetota bacterium]
MKYIGNGDKLDSAWTITDLATATELAGKWTKASDYSIQFPTDKSAEVTLTWKPDNPELHDPRWGVMRIASLKTGVSTYEDVDPPK